MVWKDRIVVEHFLGHIYKLWGFMTAKYKRNEENYDVVVDFCV